MELTLEKGGMALKGDNCQSGIRYPVKISIRHDAEIKMCLRKLRFVTRKTIIKEMLAEVLDVEEKGYQRETWDFRSEERDRCPTKRSVST